MIERTRRRLAERGVACGEHKGADVGLSVVAASDGDDGLSAAIKNAAALKGPSLRVLLLAEPENPIVAAAARETIRDAARRAAPSKRIVGVVARAGAEADAARVIAYVVGAPSVTGQIIDPGAPVEDDTRA